MTGPAPTIAASRIDLTSGDHRTGGHRSERAASERRNGNWGALAGAPQHDDCSEPPAGRYVHRARKGPTTATLGSPVSAVESFYQLAAAHRYTDAWALADPTFRSQLGGYDSFQAGQTGDRSIASDSADITGQSSTDATVAVRTTSVRTNATQHCAGSIDLVSGSTSRGWLLHLIHINCT